MTPYSEGTLNVTNGSTSVTGNGTYWLSQIKVGDKLTLDHDTWYLVSSVESDTDLTIDTAYKGATGLTQKYVIARDSSSWGMNADVAGDVTELMKLYKFKLEDVLTHKFQVLGYYQTVSALSSAVSSPTAGALYGVGSAVPYDYYQWDAVAGEWVNLGPIAVAGAPGISLRYRGVWASNRVYDDGTGGYIDLVTNNYAAFACIVGHTSGASTEPNKGVSWSSCWSLYVAQGEEPAHQFDSTSIRFQNPDGTWGDWADLLGPAETASANATAKAKAAANSAAAAANSASAAATSETNAAVSASAAASGATVARNLATAAAESESAAATSATNAAASETNAAASETSAASSASAAESSKTAAASSASAAATSETNAAASAEAAATSAIVAEAAASDAASIIYKGTSAPTNTSQLWINTSNNTLNYHNGTTWVAIRGVYA